MMADSLPAVLLTTLMKAVKVLSTQGSEDLIAWRS